MTEPGRLVTMDKLYVAGRKVLSKQICVLVQFGGKSSTARTNTNANNFYKK